MTCYPILGDDLSLLSIAHDRAQLFLRFRHQADRFTVITARYWAASVQLAYGPRRLSIVRAPFIVCIGDQTAIGNFRHCAWLTGDNIGSGTPSLRTLGLRKLPEFLTFQSSRTLSLGG